MKTLFIFGLGYSATHFAQLALQKGWRVIGTCRTSDHIEPLSKMGIEVILFDGENSISDFCQRLENVTHILHSIGPNPDTGDCVFNLHCADLINLQKLEDVWRQHI